MELKEKDSILGSCPTYQQLTINEKIIVANVIHQVINAPRDTDIGLLFGCAGELSDTTMRCWMEVLQELSQRPANP